MKKINTLVELIQELAAYEIELVALIKTFVCTPYKRWSIKKRALTFFDYESQLATTRLRAPEAFWWCRGVMSDRLTTVVMPDSVTHLAACVFAYYTSLAVIKLSDNLTHIGNNAFDGCSNLKEITLPKSLTHIGGEAFTRCTSLTCILIPESVEHIGRSAFQNCDTLVRAVFAGERVTRVSNCMFQGCHMLAHVALPTALTHIDAHAFSGCSRLKRLTRINSGVDGYLPDTLVSIGSSAFHECGALQSIRIPPGAVCAVDALWGAACMYSSH
jgi:hypothetical protein